MPRLSEMSSRLKDRPAEEPVTIPEQAIRERAYHIWQRKGSGHGHHMEDWAQAQQELAAEFQGSASRLRLSGR